VFSVQSFGIIRGRSSYRELPIGLKISCHLFRGIFRRFIKVKGAGKEEDGEQFNSDPDDDQGLTQKLVIVEETGSIISALLVP
jgi:hypothetical protein